MYEQGIQERPDFSPGLLTFSVSPKAVPLEDALLYPTTMSALGEPWAGDRLELPGLEEAVSRWYKGGFSVTRTFDVGERLLLELASQPGATGLSYRPADAIAEDPLGLAHTFTLRVQVDAKEQEDAIVQLNILAGELREVEGITNVSLVPLRYAMGHQPSDPGYGNQWHHTIIGSEFAWDVTMGDPSISVAVVDSGVDLDHEDLAPNIGETANKTDPPYAIDVPIGWELDDSFVGPDKPPKDDAGHGTHVAGIIGAAEGNGIGVVGVAPRCRLAVVKSLIQFKSVRDHRRKCVLAPADEVARGIIEAAQMEGVKVINLSVGGRRPTMVEVTALMAAQASGCVVTVSAGNDGAFSLRYPAAYKVNRPHLMNHMLVVGATTEEDFIAHFSNFGDFIDVVAPGTNIYSTCRGNRYGFMEGTSMSAPIVAGLAALLFSVRPRASERQVVEAIIRNANECSPGGKNFYFGFGRVDAERAVAGF